MLCRAGGIMGFAMACSNTFGLVTGAFLLGFGLSEIPKNIWKTADWTRRQKFLYHRIANMAGKFDNAHQEYCHAIAVCTFPHCQNIISVSYHCAKGLFLSLLKVVQATSKQMTKREPLRPFMDIIDDMLAQMVWMLRYNLKLTFKYCGYI